MSRRKSNDRDELIRCVTAAREIVNVALPATPVDDSHVIDRLRLREIAFGMVLRELLDYES